MTPFMLRPPGLPSITAIGRRALLPLTVCIALLASVLVVSPTGAAADHDVPPPSATFVTHGWGHGWGLGQYGAYGYARNEGWSSAQILDHFYGGTSGGVVPGGWILDPSELRIDLRSDRGAVTTLRLPSGSIDLTRTSNGAPEGSFTDGAVRLIPNNIAPNDPSRPPNGFFVEIGAGCAGPWTRVHEIIDEATVAIGATTAATGADGLLRYCRSDGRETSYPGTFEAVLWDGQPRTVNVVAVDDYLRGVVPKEVPAWWGDDGQAALEAQAVAARSYVLASDDRYTNTFADSCDTTLCQVYGGWFETPTAANPDGVVTDPRTDAAIATTAGVVRIRNDNGDVARTFFSSSTGSHTNPIDPFPAVIDLGDSVSANPNHNRTVTVDLSPLERSYSSLGQLIEIEVTGRNGLNGVWNNGGRVTTVTLHFADGTASMTGAQLRSRLGLRSDWFTVGPVTRAGVAAADIVTLAYEVFIGAPPTTQQLIDGTTMLASGQRRQLMETLVGSDEWAGVLIDDLYNDVLDRPADPVGRDYWRGAMADGLAFEAVGTLFYGAEEYFIARGGTNEAFIESLYVRILDRPLDQVGFDYWLGELAADRATIVDVAAGFYNSVESRRQRTTNLFERILGRTPEEASLGYWSGLLATATDLELAVELAMSDEFTTRATG